MPNAEGKKVLMIVAQENFRDEELFNTKEELEKAGAQATIASREKGTVSGSRGGTAQAILALDSVNVSEFDAVVFIGGPGAAEYFDDAIAQQIAKDAFSQGKVLAAICIAPSILANAGLLEGKKATAFSGEAGNLQAKGATFTGKSVEVDGKIITADGPASARAFGKAIAEALGQ